MTDVVHQTDGRAPLHSAGHSVDHGGTRPTRSLSGPVGALAVFVALVPFAIDPWGWYVTVAFRWLAVVAVAGVTLVWALVADRQDGSRRTAVPGARWWLALVAVAIGSALASSAPLTSVLGTIDRRFGALTWLTHGALFLAAATAVRTRHHLATIARGLVIATGLVTVFTAVQQLGWDFPAHAVNRVRPGGPFGNADLLGLYCVLGVLVAAGMALDAATSIRWRVMSMVAAAGGVATIAATGSRGAWIGLGVGTVGLAWHAAGHAAGPRRLRPAALAGAALVLVLTALLVSGTAGRLTELTGGTVAGRVETWTRAADAALERPVLGWGPEGFSEAFGPQVDDGYERAYTRRLMPDRAHSAPIDVAVSLGLIGLVVWVGLLLRVGGAATRAIRRDGSTVAVAVGCATLGALVAGLALFPTFDVDALAWVLVGAVVGLGRSFREAEDPERRERSPAYGRRMIGAVAAITVIAVVVAAVGVVADHSARDASDRLQVGAPGAALIAARRAVLLEPAQVLPALALADAAMAQGDDPTLRWAIAELESVRGRTFDDGRLTLAVGRLTLACDTCDRGRITVEIARLVARDPARTDAWSMAGDLAADRGALGDAVSFHERATDLAPGEDRRWRDLAAARCANGQTTEARTAALHALAADPDDEANLRALTRIDAASCPSLYTSPP